MGKRAKKLLKMLKKEPPVYPLNYFITFIWNQNTFLFQLAQNSYTSRGYKLNFSIEKGRQKNISLP